MGGFHSPYPPSRVVFPVMRQRWEQLTFLHWSYDPDVVQALLPEGLVVEPWDGGAWVGLVPFHMRVRGPVGPSFPLVSRFPETNVRTYVRGPGGDVGLWFFSLDAANPPAVVTARALWGLPYYVASMRIETSERRISYLAHRRTGLGSRAGHLIDVRIGERIPAHQLGEFDHYLTARFVLWSTRPGMLLRTGAEHPPWQLRRARVERLQQSCLEAAGLPAPEGDPVVHYADGVETRIGAPTIAARE